MKARLWSTLQFTVQHDMSVLKHIIPSQTSIRAVSPAQMNLFIASIALRDQPTKNITYTIRISSQDGHQSQAEAQTQKKSTPLCKCPPITHKKQQSHSPTHQNEWNNNNDLADPLRNRTIAASTRFPLRSERQRILATENPTLRRQRLRPLSFEICIRSSRRVAVYCVAAI